MAGRRTDLALEAKEIWEEGAAEAAVLEGVEAAAGEREGFPTETVHILDRRGEEALGKPVGRYVTLTLDGLARREEGAFGRAARAVAGELAGLLEGVPAGGLALVVGLGNRAITPDALGPKVHDHTLVTRHLVEGCPEHFGAFARWPPCPPECWAPQGWRAASWSRQCAAGWSRPVWWRWTPWPPGP